MSQAGRPRYWPALDGVRAVAVGLVVAYHLDPATVQRGGTIGVTVFFTLSGFLITSLLLTESDRLGTVSLRRFYARRALRLLPALAVLVPVVAAYASLSDRHDDTVSAVPAVLLYVGNWVRALRGFETLGMFEHAWSLAVEEQFYLVWPLVLLGVALLAGRRHRAAGVLVAAIVGSAASITARLALWNDLDPVGSAARLVNGTDAVADQLLIGCALAAVLHLWSARASHADQGRSLSPAPRVALGILGPTALAFLVWVSIARPGGATVANNHRYLTWGATVFALAAALVVLASVVDERGPLARLLSLRPVAAIGRVSYGVYLWHYPVILAVQAEMAGSSATLRRVVAVALTGAATWASWCFVERPMLARKHRFEAPAAPAEPVAGGHFARTSARLR